MASVEALDHAVRLRMTRRYQTVFDGDRSADFVESVLAAGLLVFGGEAVGELRAVVGQDLADLDG